MNNYKIEFEDDIVINLYLRVLAVVSVLGLYSSLLRVHELGWLPIMNFHIFICVFHASVTLFATRLSYKFKSTYLVFLFTSLGYASILTFGINGLGISLLTLIVLLTSFFFGSTYALFSTLLIGVSLLILGKLASHKIIAFSDLTSPYSYSTWVTACISFVFIQAFVYLFPFIILKSFSKKNTEMKAISDELQNAMQVIQKQNLERKQLLHMLCHDLSNPLGAIDSIFEFYKEDPEIFHEMIDHLQIAVKSGHDVISTVRELLAVEENKKSIRCETIAVSKLIEDAYAILEYKFKEKGVKLDYSIDRDITIFTDASTFLNSILNNLLTNALKFSFEGSSIQLKSWVEGNTTTLQIIDQGIGMPQSLIDKLFRLDKTTTRNGTSGERGTGFGMPIVKKFVELFKGDIHIDSQEKTADSNLHGTTITLHFPANAETP